MLRVGLRFRLVVPLACVLILYVAVHAYLTGKTYRQEIFADASENTLRLADAIRRSTRQAMLLSRRDDVHQMIEEIGRQEGIEHIRILNKQGEIVYSSAPDEIDRVVNRTAEGCYQCHDAAEPLTRLDMAQRTRVFDSPVGHRTLAAIEVVYNEPACWTAACHAHPESHELLGVLDVGVSLADADRRAAHATRYVMLVGFFSTVLICGLVGLFVDRFVIQPVRSLVELTRRIAEGDLDVSIQATRTDELGQLGRSFNKMTEDLQAARGELSTWAHKLEQEVESKTRDLRTAQAHVVRSEKLSSVGVLAAGVAHELNNPLTGILTYAHLAARKLPDGSPQKADIQVITEQAQRCATVIRQLLDFSRESRPERSLQDIHAIIDQAVSLVEPQPLYQQFHIERRYSADVSPVPVDAAQIQQVLVNLLINAGQAMSDGGRLTITTQQVEPSASQEPAKVRIVVQDTGVGIPESCLTKVFDPFFTSKEVGQGIGLGLAVSYGIMERHNGTIEVESRTGQGTTFTITLPCETTVE